MAARMEHYPIEIFWSDEDEGFIAIVPDLPGCSAWGATEAEALKEIHKAEAAWIGAAKASGKPIPPPSKPAEYEYSGRFLLRTPKELHADLARSARTQGVSLNQYVLYLLTKNQAEAVAARKQAVLSSAPSSQPKIVIISSQSQVGYEPKKELQSFSNSTSTVLTGFEDTHTKKLTYIPEIVGNG